MLVLSVRFLYMAGGPDMDHFVVLALNARHSLRSSRKVSLAHVLLAIIRLVASPFHLTILSPLHAYCSACLSYHKPWTLLWMHTFANAYPLLAVPHRLFITSLNLWFCTYCCPPCITFFTCILYILILIMHHLFYLHLLPTDSHHAVSSVQSSIDTVLALVYTARIYCFLNSTH